MSAVITEAVSWAVGIAQDDSHGYSQYQRWGPDYDCSSLVISAYEQAGVPVKEAGATYTGNMRRAFEKCGFKSIKYGSGTVLKKGDVLLREKHHAAMYIGDGQIVQASVAETGKIYGKEGDQTTREIYLRNFYVSGNGWDYILRYEEQESEVMKVHIEMPVLRYGAKCSEVGLIQTLLNSFGYVGKNKKKLTVDSDWGINTDYAFEAFQKDPKKSGVLTVDKICGQKSWNALLHHQF